MPRIYVQSMTDGSALRYGLGPRLLFRYSFIRLRMETGRLWLRLDGSRVSSVFCNGLSLCIHMHVGKHAY